MATQDSKQYPTVEHRRLAQEAARESNWKRWGPYLSERQWGTVREDYSTDGSCWEHFPFEHAHQRVYRWGEDGLLGFTDRECRLCFCVGLWNGEDAILKERLYGLTGPQGNHGEDVKEHYWYLDATPTHSYNKAAYHYPHAAFPYEQLKKVNGKRGRDEPEFELADTGVFEGDKYFDVLAEYAKADADDVLIRITLRNQASEGDAKTLHVLPQFWFRNTWMWGCEHEGCTLKPAMWTEPKAPAQIKMDHQTLGRFTAHVGTGPGGKTPPLLFTENLTNTSALYGDTSPTAHTKDGLARHVIDGQAGAVNRRCAGPRPRRTTRSHSRPGSR